MDAIRQPPPSIPRWIESPFKLTPGMDPLGLQSITIDRIMPELVPGILALSRRARYFSFYPFLIDELRNRDPKSTQEELSNFIKHREYELALAVNMCTNCGGTATGAVGTLTAGPKVHRGDQEFSRMESVESFLGGYGLYYRTPFRVLGIVAPKGEYIASRDAVLPRDHLRPGIAENLAEQYRLAVENTRYYRDFFGGTQAIPKEVLQEFAEHGCLCRLDDHPEEQSLIQRAILEVQEIKSLNPNEVQGFEHDTEQRRRSVALLLWVLGGGVGRSRTTESMDEYFRRNVWHEDSRILGQDSGLACTLAQWSGLTSRDYMQEGLAAIWSHLCSKGRRLQPVDGMGREALENFLQHTLLEDNSVALGETILTADTSSPTSHFEKELLQQTAELDLEELREIVANSNTALSGLMLLLVLNDRLKPEFTERTSWKQVAAQRSNWQPGLYRFLTLLREHLSLSPSLGETMSWLTKRFIIDVHERNAFSKLPNYTFRFRWEDGRLRFLGGGVDRLSLPDTRLDSVTTIGADLGLIRRDGAGHALTERGWSYFREVLG